MKRTLSVVPDTPARSASDPPRHLIGVGLEWWRTITAAYEFSDPGSYAVLAEACYAVQRADQLREQIDRDGIVLRTKTGIRSHPCHRDEVAFRALAARLIKSLGLDLEPVRDRPNRPSGR